MCINVYIYECSKAVSALMIINSVQHDRMGSNIQLMDSSVRPLTADQSFRKFDVPWWILCSELDFVAGGGVLVVAATHSGTGWQSPRWPWPRACPGRRGDISGSRPPLYDAGRRRAASPARPRSTRWRGRYTCTWGRQRRRWKRLICTHTRLLGLLLRCKSCFSFPFGTHRLWTYCKNNMHSWIFKLPH